MTVQDYIDEIKLRLNRYDIETHIDDWSVLNYINKARRDVQSWTIDLFPEYYATSVTINVTGAKEGTDYIVAVPGDLIKEYVVIFQYIKDGVTHRQLCREAVSREFSTVKTHAWVTPTGTQPVYILTSDTLTAGDFNARNYILFLNTSIDFGTISNPQIEIYYTAMLDNLDLPISTGGVVDDDTTIPEHLTELVIYKAMMYSYEIIKSEKTYLFIKRDVEALMETVQMSYDIQDLKERMLPSKEGEQ